MSLHGFDYCRGNMMRKEADHHLLIQNRQNGYDNTDFRNRLHCLLITHAPHHWEISWLLRLFKCILVHTLRRGSPFPFLYFQETQHIMQLECYECPNDLTVRQMWMIWDRQNLKKKDGSVYYYGNSLHYYSLSYLRQNESVYNIRFTKNLHHNLTEST